LNSIYIVTNQILVKTNFGSTQIYCTNQIELVSPETILVQPNCHIACPVTWQITVMIFHHKNVTDCI